MYALGTITTQTGPQLRQRNVDLKKNNTLVLMHNSYVGSTGLNLTQQPRSAVQTFGGEVEQTLSLQMNDRAPSREVQIKLTNRRGVLDVHMSEPGREMPIELLSGEIGQILTYEYPIHEGHAFSQYGKEVFLPGILDAKVANKVKLRYRNKSKSFQLTQEIGMFEMKEPFMLFDLNLSKHTADNNYTRTYIDELGRYWKVKALLDDAGVLRVQATPPDSWIKKVKEEEQASQKPGGGVRIRLPEIDLDDILVTTAEAWKLISQKLMAYAQQLARKIEKTDKYEHAFDENE